jgi:hypothetical protein
LGERIEKRRMALSVASVEVALDDVGNTKGR